MQWLQRKKSNILGVRFLLLKPLHARPLRSHTRKEMEFQEDSTHNRRSFSKEFKLKVVK